MPTAIELLSIIRQLRHAPTRLAPLEVVERMQHMIVRLEHALAADALPPTVEVTYTEAKQLLAYCVALSSAK